MKKEPVTPHRIIDRPRLLRQIEESTARTILLIAPAGYGKTTLLRQWLAGASGVAVTISHAEADVVSLARIIARGLSALRPSLPQAIEASVLASSPDQYVQAIASTLIAETPAEATPWILVDDFHRLHAGSAGDVLIETLAASSRFRLLVASRTRPSWATARRLLYGDLLELSQADLALSPDEIARLFEHERHPEATELPDHGWPALVALRDLGAHSAQVGGSRRSVAIHDFLRDEVFDVASTEAKRSLLRLALLPALAREPLYEVLGGKRSVDHVVGTGLAYETPDGLIDIHPLLRDLLHERLAADSNRTLVGSALKYCLSESHWEHAFFLICRFDRSDQIATLLTTSFNGLVETGRFETLEAFRAYAAKNGDTPQPLLDLISAELSFRGGAFAQARRLAVAASEALQAAHPLRPRAYVLAGMSSHLSWHLHEALELFTTALEIAQRPRDRNDAALARCVTALFLEHDHLASYADDLGGLTETTAEDRLRVLMARHSSARLTGHLYEATEDAALAKALLPDVANPIVRTGWANTYGYTLILQGQYEEARDALMNALTEVDRYRLEFARPHLEWSLAAAELGLRQFKRVETLLRRVEAHADAAGSAYLEMNARCLRARLLLALGKPDRAVEHTSVDFGGSPRNAMTGEYLGTRALALAAAGRADDALTAAHDARCCSRAVEVQVLAAAARAIALITTDNHTQEHCKELLALAESLGSWDGIVCAIRATPSLAQGLTRATNNRGLLARLLTHSRDFDLAHFAGLTKKRPQAKRGPLSARETDVILLLGQGLRTRDIAGALYIAPSTVKVHIRHIFEKLDVHTRAEAVARYAEASE